MEASVSIFCRECCALNFLQISMYKVNRKRRFVTCRVGNTCRNLWKKILINVGWRINSFKVEEIHEFIRLATVCNGLPGNFFFFYVSSIHFYALSKNSRTLLKKIPRMCSNFFHKPNNRKSLVTLKLLLIFPPTFVNTFYSRFGEYETTLKATNPFSLYTLNEYT